MVGMFSPPTRYAIFFPGLFNAGTPCGTSGATAAGVECSLVPSLTPLFLNGHRELVPGALSIKTTNIVSGRLGGPAGTLKEGPVGKLWRSVPILDMLLHTSK
eukprot:1147305-Pelagomonas_calceolata.AAC.5